jgi:hypothetical protein
MKFILPSLQTSSFFLLPFKYERKGQVIISQNASF